MFMKRFLIFVVIFLFGCGENNFTNSNFMNLSSSAFENEGFIPSIYTCEGGGVNPPLSFVDLPEGVKSLVLILDDPDAPGGTWDHWIVGGIDPANSLIGEDSVPGAWMGKNSWGEAKYGGPCPPSGVHRYVFKLYALDILLEMGENDDKFDVENAMEGHILDSAELIGLYQKNF